MNPVDQAILDNDSLPANQRLSNRALARKIGVGETTIRRHRRRIRKNVEREHALHHDAFFTDLPLSSITKRGITRRLPDGSYEKVEFKPLPVEAEEARRLAWEDVEKVLSNPALGPDTTRSTTEATLVVCLADPQVGKTDQAGGSQETIKRAVDAIHRAAADVRKAGGYREIILADLGDAVEGFGNVVSQQQTNDLSITDQIRVVMRLYLEALKTFAPLCERLVQVSVPSNHCAVRTGRGASNRSNTPDDDYGLLVQDFMAAAVDGREGYNHIQFARPEKWEEAITVQVQDGTNVAFTHGHLAGSQNKVPQWFRDLAFGHRSGLHQADVLVHGHFHNFGVSTVGKDRYIVSCPTLDNGSSWFTNTSGKSSAPAMLTFEAARHRPQNWTLYYDGDA